jgi:uncharacterized DUF497 family protein
MNASGGLGFSSRCGVFLDDTIEHLDSRHDLGDDRIVSIGRIEGAEPVVVHTWRADELGEPLRWVISARLANRGERTKYAAFFD